MSIEIDGCQPGMVDPFVTVPVCADDGSSEASASYYSDSESEESVHVETPSGRRSGYEELSLGMAGAGGAQAGTDSPLLFLKQPNKPEPTEAFGGSQDQDALLDLEVGC
jgi:hypothetical protein